MEKMAVAYPGVSFRKRNNSGGSDQEGPQAKLSRDFLYYYKLEPESSPPSDEDTESIYSLQDKPTDSVKDTSDTTCSSIDGDMIITIGDGVMREPLVSEYEPASLSDHSSLQPDVITSASNSDTEQLVETIVISVTEAQDDGSWADTSSLSSDSEAHTRDPEIPLTDYWSCVQCKATNNNPLFRYCERCFKVRKHFFPPRPKGKNRKKRKTRKRQVTRRDSSEPKPSTSGSTDFESMHTDLGSEVKKEPPKGNEPFSSVCGTCITRPKDGVFVHGRKFGHMYCCYQCSKKVWRDTGRCPLCNRKVMQVLKIIS